MIIQAGTGTALDRILKLRCHLVSAQVAQLALKRPHKDLENSKVFRLIILRGTGTEVDHRLLQMNPVILLAQSVLNQCYRGPASRGSSQGIIHHGIGIAVDQDLRLTSHPALVDHTAHLRFHRGLDNQETSLKTILHGTGTAIAGFLQKRSRALILW